MSARRPFWRRMARDRGAWVGAGLIGIVLVMALSADLAPWGPREMDLEAHSTLPPSAGHWLGTDASGYDVFSRLLHGARLSLLTGLCAVVLSLAVGVPLGMWSGWLGGRLDSLLMRIVDVLLAFPSVVLAIVIASLLDARTLVTVIVAVAVVNVPVIARQMRGSVLQIKEQDYVMAARAAGLPSGRIISRHVLPNCLAPLLVLATLGVGHSVLASAGLSFLGLGPESRTAEWGVMLRDGYRYVTSREQWVVIPPGLGIAATGLGFNLLGDALRRALDPRAA